MSDNDYYTIEPDRSGYGGMPFNVYGWGTWEQGSLLAGQQRKTYIDGFMTLEEAQEEYPDANFGFQDSNNTYDHLPEASMSAREEEDYFYGTEAV